MMVATGAQMRAIENRLFAKNVSPLELMRRAGDALGQTAFASLRSRGENTALVMCGKGKNGGDGYAAAYYLRIRGVRVICYFAGGGDEAPETAYYREMYLKTGGICEKYTKIDENYGVVIDALFGTGFRGEAEGLYRQAICDINSSHATVISADIPSGLYCNGGNINGECVRADITVAFGLPKPAHFLSPAYMCCGKLIVADIGIPEYEIRRENLHIFAADASFARIALKKRREESNKTDYGRLFMVCGSVGLTGAPELAAQAAGRSGAGLVSLGIPPDAYAAVASKLCEAMPFPLNDEETMLQKLAGADACLAGCGSGNTEETRGAVFSLIQNAVCPLILDADGINALCGHIDILKTKRTPLIITPHDGELQRLTGTFAAGAERIDTAFYTAQKLNVILVMKGHRTITASPDGRIAINTTGNAGMARGGSGDLLAGIIAALCASGADPFYAAAAGAYIHGRAGDICAAEFGQTAMTPSDMLGRLGAAFKEIEKG